MSSHPSRPAIDVVVPFVGSEAELRELLERLQVLRLRAGDTLTVVDNRMAGEPVDHPAVLSARAMPSSSYARNAGAARGGAEWILFIDADVDPDPDILDRYFAPGEPGERVGILAGMIRDREPAPGANGRQPPAARYAFLRQSMAQGSTKARLEPFAKTANALFRREAFEAVGGFQDRLRFGEDVDLCYRMRYAGWELEFRCEPVVEHLGHESVRALLAQQSRHGRGTQYLDSVYPGFSPPFRYSSLLVSLARGALKAAWLRLRGESDRALIELFDPLTALAFHLGRLRRDLYAPAAPADRA
jgi:GT2 family glycosyltransferase